MELAKSVEAISLEREVLAHANLSKAPYLFVHYHSPGDDPSSGNAGRTPIQILKIVAIN